MSNELFCEKQNICASWQLSCLFTLHHLLYLREFCQRSHPECVLSPFGCCLLSAAPFSLDRFDFTVHTSQQWSTYLCSTPSAVASGHNLSADSGTIFCQHLSPALMAKSASCIKTCLRREKNNNISAKEKVVSVLNWDAMFASRTSQPVCRFCLRGIKIKMLYVFYVLWIMHGGKQQAGRQPSYTVPLLVPSMQTVNDQRGCVIQIIISNDLVFLTSTLKCRPRGRRTPNDNIPVHLRTEQSFPSGPRFRIKFSFRRVGCHIV